MRYSIVNNDFATANAAEIAALAEVGVFEPLPIGQCSLLSGVDIRDMVAPTNLYNVPAPEIGESPMDYGMRVQAEVVAGVEQIIAGALDGLVLDDESGIELYRQLVGWNDPVVI